METKNLYYAEMRIIIDCDKLKKGKTGGKLCVERKKKRKDRKERKRNKQGCENFLGPLTSAYAYQCGLVERAHPASGAAITL